MYSRSGRQIRHGYSVIRVSLDDHSDLGVPVGVVAWQTANPWFGWRWLEHDEKVRGVDPATRRLMRITRNQIQRWANARKVPYEPAPVEPTSDRFWKAVSEILSTSVRLDLPKAMDPMDEPDAEIEALFEAVVQPGQTHQRRSLRIDYAIKQASASGPSIFPRGRAYQPSVAPESRFRGVWRRSGASCWSKVSIWPRQRLARRRTPSCRAT